MRKAFMCSLCHKGIQGGGLYLDAGSLIYRTQKLTVNERYRNLVMPLNEIGKVTWKWAIFPMATFHMKNGEKIRIIIFNKRRFDKYYRMQEHFSEKGE
ncbi:MAG: hypothetical protein NC548_16805 [Lachnospiraceae bacterium]|nr:hypothetical protein [Lachnospiraceae bacterium]